MSIFPKINNFKKFLLLHTLSKTFTIYYNNDNNNNIYIYIYIYKIDNINFDNYYLYKFYLSYKLPNIKLWRDWTENLTIEFQDFWTKINLGTKWIIKKILFLSFLNKNSQRVFKNIYNSKI